MADEEKLNPKQKKEIAKRFLLNAPAGEIHYVAKDVKAILEGDEEVYESAASEAFPVYNKSHMICLDFPDRSGEVCTDVRPTSDEELLSPYIEEFRCALDAEVIKYVSEAYPKGFCSVYCMNGKDVDGPGSDFEFVVVISAARDSPQNFCNGSWRSIWNIDFKDEEQIVEVRGKLQVGAHYFEEGNVQLDSQHECNDSTIFQSPEDSATTLISIIRHHETEYLASLEASYLNLSDTTFKDLRRKLPVTRTLFPWHNTLQISLTRDLSKELGVNK